MTTERNIIIHQGQAFALSLDYAGTAGRGQRMHIRLADSTATVVQILTHNGDANARVLFDGAAALDITIGASVSAGWVVLADRVEWVYDIEDYDLADEDDCVIPYRGKVIVRGNRTRASDVTPSDQMPSGDGRYVRFDGVQGLSAGQQLQARENIGATLGTGDVVGPASATDDRIAAFDGVTGKLIKQGSVTATAVASHLGSTSNPHSVTAAQAGADPTGTAAAAVVAHAGATDPHGDRSFATSAVSTHNAVTTAHGTSAFGATLVDDADAATARTTLGLGTAATTAATDYATAAHTHSGVYQPADADLTTWAGITPGTGVGTALGTNVGTAGAVVVNGGALGTPSSATLTNATGLPPAGITQSGATSNQVLAWNGSAWAPATPSAGSGDVVGPASATDNAIARYDSTTGKLLQDSSATLADSGALSLTMDDAGTNTVLFPLKVARTSSGTPANGIGVGHQFEVETTAGNNEIGATLTAEVTDVTAASEDFALVVKTMVAGSTTLVEGGRFVGAQFRAVDGSASAPSVSFSSGGFGFYSAGGVAAFSAAFIMQYYFNSGETRFRQSYAQNYMASGASIGGTVNASFAHAGDNAFVFSDSANPVAGTAKSRQEKNKQVTAIADATATTVFTVTVPNAAHSASIKVMLVGSIGAGGAIGANEATGTVAYDIAIARTAGVNAVATISAAYGSVTSAVAGATTITVTGDLGAVSGAVGASNTFTIRVTITKGGGSSANHTCMAYARIVNANATGITII